MIQRFTRRLAPLAALLLGSTTSLLVAGPSCAPAGGPDPAATSGVASADEKTPEWEAMVGGGPGVPEADRFHPERDRAVTPRRGGKVTVHVSSMPKHINYSTENSATTRRILYEVHEALVEQDWETWEPKPSLATSWVIEDTLILPGGRGADNSNIAWGKITDAGDEWLVEPQTRYNPLTEPTRFAKEGAELQQQNVFTFFLRDNVKWHDGVKFTAHDAKFSHDILKNPAVDCEHMRYKWKGGFSEALDDYVFRYFYEVQYFMAKHSFTDLTMLPRHVYDLTDPTNKDYKADATLAEQGTYINEHPANRSWIGLGPYRVTDFSDEGVRTQRFADYYDPEHGGYVDSIYYRHIASDDTAKQAVINGQLDYWERLRTEDYFGEFIKQKVFTDNLYAGLASYNYFGYTAWNTRRPQLADPVVRRALGMCFDWTDFIQSQYKGLASRMTGTQYYFAPHYDRSIEPIPFSLTDAEDLLLEAGWFDRDGDDIIDKDGVPMRLTFLMPTGNKASEIFGQAFQENLGKIGVKLDIDTREWATFLEDLYERRFDCANLAWITPTISDPEQIWHSSQADTPRSSNHSGFKDPVVDELIEEIQHELDEQKLIELFSRMQRRIYEQQPYMFGVNQPKKFVASRKIRNLKTYAIDPGYRVREWFVVDDSTGGSKPREAGAER